MFHGRKIWEPLNLSNWFLFTSTKTGFCTLWLYSRFQGHIAAGRIMTRAQAPTLLVRCAFHPWKMGFFYLFIFLSTLDYISWCGSGANLVSRDFASEGSDLIRHRQFPVSLRCSLAECYFSWWIYCGVKHAHRARSLFFLNELAYRSLSVANLAFKFIDSDSCH